MSQFIKVLLAIDNAYTVKGVISLSSILLARSCSYLANL